MFKRSVWEYLLFVSAIFFMASSALAQSTQVDYYAGSGGVQESGSVPNPVSTVTFATADDISSNSISGFATYGVLKASSASSAPRRDLGGAGTASVTSSFRDVLNFSSDGLGGQEGFVVSKIAYSWMHGVNGVAATTQSDIVFELNGGAYAQEQQTRNELGLTDVYVDPGISFGPGVVLDATPGKDLTVRVPILFGADYGLTVSLFTVVSASSNYQGGSSAFINASNSAYWGGVQYVTNSLGEQVDFTVSSLSGTDYSQSFVPAPVPEPETYAMLIAGLAVVAGALRRRSKFAAQLQCAE